MRKSFSQFLDKKSRDAKRQLHIVREILQRSGMSVSDFIENADEDELPYVYLKNTITDSSFGGVRIYKIGDQIAFRVQREAKTQPYGNAYMLDIPGMFDDLIQDYSEEEAGKKVIEAAIKELKRFFVLSSKAEKELQTSDIVTGGLGGKIILQSTGVSDYSTTVP